MKPEDKLRIISQSIWIKNNSPFLSKDEVYKLINELDQFCAFSIRQLSNISNNKISSTTLNRYLPSKARQGGRLNPQSLEDILQCFHDKENGLVNYRLVRKILSMGTSQNMLARLTGIPQSKISREVLLNGSVLS
jgi:hypothetical protein